MAATTREIIEGLRDEIRRIERRPPRRASFAASGRREIDALLPGGGFPRGALSEIAGGRASGKTAVALSTIAVAVGERGIAAFVDGRGELYPPAAAALGVDLERLLIVRPCARGGGDAARIDGARAALWAAEALLASGAFAAVALDLALPRAHLRGAAALDAMLRRLRAAAERGGSVALSLAAEGDVHITGALRLELSRAGGVLRARRALGAGEITEQEFDQREDELLDRLEAAMHSGDDTGNGMMR
jgi:protein ImuA